jgi:hypothetical protein
MVLTPIQQVSRRGLISDVKAELCRQLGLRSKEGLTPDALGCSLLYTYSQIST